jgi:hypothetical protein
VYAYGFGYGQQADRRLVGPVQVLEHDHHRRGLRQRREQIAHALHDQPLERLAVDAGDVLRLASVTASGSSCSDIAVNPTMSAKSTVARRGSLITRQQ